MFSVHAYRLVSIPHHSNLTSQSYKEIVAESSEAHKPVSLVYAEAKMRVP